MAQYLKLDAVNLMLEAISEDPVASLSSGLDDAELALSKLEQVTRRELAKGWHFNTEGNRENPVTLTPTVDNDIPIADTVLRVDTVRDSVDIDVTVREGKLYNIKDRTFNFTKAVQVEWVLDLDFESLPYHAANWLAHQAAYEFAKNRLGSGAVGAQIKEDLQNSWMAFLDADGEEEDANVFTDSPDMAYLTYRRNRLNTYRRY